MPQAIDTTLFNRAAKKVNEGARAIAPEWLADFLAPPEASVELTDMLTPMGSVMSKGTGLLAALGNKFKKAPVRTPTLVPGPVSEAKSKEIFDAVKRRPATVPSIKERRSHLVPNESDAQTVSDMIFGGDESGPRKLEGDTWSKLLQSVKKEKPSSTRHVSNMFPMGHPNNESVEQLVLGSKKVAGESDFIRDMNKLEINADTQRQAMQTDLAQQGGANALTRSRAQGPLSQEEIFQKVADRQRNANIVQQDLPLDVPLISHSPNVSPRRAEEAGKVLNNLLGNRETQMGRAGVRREPGDYVRSLHVTDTPDTNVFHEGKKRIMVSDPEDLGELANSVGHETQHAFDFRDRPKIFENYPDLSGYETPKGYSSHPSEVVARGRGNHTQFKFGSDKAGQLTLPEEFLLPLENGNEAIRGLQDEDMLDLITNMKNKYGFNLAPPVPKENLMQRRIQAPLFPVKR